MARRSARYEMPVIEADAVGPWCYIGKRKLEAALSELGRRDTAAEPSVRWHPVQLNPDLPPQGIPRQTYLHTKFGSAEVGIAFDFDRIQIQPYTLAAHRLIAWVQDRADAASTSDLVERLFQAYFVQGRAIGEPDELAQIASEAGLGPAAARAMLASTENLAAVSADDREARNVGINGVPFFIFNGSTAVSGAHDPETLLKAIAAARSQST